MHGDPCHHRYLLYMSQPCAEASFGLTRGSCYSAVHLDDSSSLLLSFAPDCQKGGCGCVMGELRLWKTKKKKIPCRVFTHSGWSHEKFTTAGQSRFCAYSAPLCGRNACTACAAFSFLFFLLLRRSGFISTRIYPSVVVKVTLSKSIYLKIDSSIPKPRGLGLR